MIVIDRKVTSSPFDAFAQPFCGLLEELGYGCMASLHRLENPDRSRDCSYACFVMSDDACRAYRACPARLEYLQGASATEE